MKLIRLLLLPSLFFCNFVKADPIKFMGLNWDMSIDQIYTVLEERGLDCYGPGEEMIGLTGGIITIKDDEINCYENPKTPNSTRLFGYTSTMMSIDSKAFNGDEVLNTDIKKSLEDSTGLRLTVTQGPAANPYYRLNTRMWCAVGEDEDEICLEPRDFGNVNDRNLRGASVTIYKHMYGREKQELSF
jgi:hypothetical protein